jgi:hypothetical protein
LKDLEKLKEEMDKKNTYMHYYKHDEVKTKEEEEQKTKNMVNKSSFNKI